MCECLVLIKNQVGLDRGKLSLGMFFCVVSSVSGHFWVLSSPSPSRSPPVGKRPSSSEVQFLRLFFVVSMKNSQGKEDTQVVYLLDRKKVWKTSNLEASFWSMSKYLCFVNLVLTSFFCPLLKKSSNQAWIQGVLACLQSIKDSWGQQGKWESYCSP